MLGEHHLFPNQVQKLKVLLAARHVVVHLLLRRLPGALVQHAKLVVGHDRLLLKVGQRVAELLIVRVHKARIRGHQRQRAHAGERVLVVGHLFLVGRHLHDGPHVALLRQQHQRMHRKGLHVAVRWLQHRHHREVLRLAFLELLVLHQEIKVRLAVKDVLIPQRLVVHQL